MKPNKKQLEIAKFVENQGKFWQQTNDISSPTHQGDISEFTMSLRLYETLTSEEARTINCAMKNILEIIQNKK